MVGVDEVVGGEGVRVDGGATGVQGFLWEEKKVGKKGKKEDRGKMKAAAPSLPPFPHLTLSLTADPRQPVR